MNTLSEILTDLDRREYEEFCLRASYANWQENEIYGEPEEDEEQWN